MWPDYSVFDMHKLSHLEEGGMSLYFVSLYHLRVNHGNPTDLSFLHQEHDTVPEASTSAHRCLWYHGLPHLQDTHLRYVGCTVGLANHCIT